MKFRQILTLALVALISMGNTLWAQNPAQSKQAAHSAEPAQVQVVSPQLTDFERYGVQADQPIVSLAFPVITEDLGADTSLTLTPRALSPLSAPNAVKALAVEFRLTQPLPLTGSNGPVRLHSIATLLDVDEVGPFRALFNSLTVAGMPQSQFSGVATAVRMVSRSGMHLEFTTQADGRVGFVVFNSADSVVLIMDTDSARKWFDAFTAAARALDSIKGSRT